MENLVKEPAIAYEHRYSLEEFLNLEINEVRYEFWDGELVDMAGTTLNHNKIVGNLYSSIRNITKGKGCGTFFLDTLLAIKNRNTYFYPDLIYTCDENDLRSERFIFNPTILVEVLSESTELYDRTKKWEIYRRIPSLLYYLLVSQNEYHIDMYHRPNEQSLFYFQAFEGTDAVISFTDPSFEICLSDIYEGIALEEAQKPDAGPNQP